MFDKKLIKLAVANKEFFAKLPPDIQSLLNECTCSDDGRKKLGLGYQRVHDEHADALADFKAKLGKYRPY